MPYSELRKGRFSEPGREYKVTTVVDGRRNLFHDLWVARACIRALVRVEAETDATLLAWVLMPNHLHVLVRLGSELSLSALLQRLKGGSAKAVNEVLNRRGTLWQPAFYDHALRRAEDRLGAARYIVDNPIRAGLVTRIGDYPHWDSVWDLWSP
jgi:REP element-mobilizing transposase RayT